MLKFGRQVEQTDAIQVYYRRGSGGKAPIAGQFSQFLEKNNRLLNVI